jgi:hypothetical protein
MLKNEATDGLKGNIDSEEEEDPTDKEIEDLESNCKSIFWIENILSKSIDFNQFYRLARD